MNPKKQKQTSPLPGKFGKEISRSLLLEESEKTFWLNKAGSLPVSLLKTIYKSVKNKNDLMDKYILAAVKEDPSLLNELKHKIDSIKKDALAAEEHASTPDAEETLKKQLEQI